MTNLAMLRSLNAERWAKAHSLKPAAFVSVATRLVNAKQRYITVQARTGVPWYAIAVIHEREASQKWNTQLGQGDPLDRVSVHVPAGRGPFKTWEDGAYDALVNCAPYAARNQDWSVGGLLTSLELYNGLGYFAHGAPSPYVWSGTDQYHSGKYVRDGVFDPNVVDAQLGCAGLLMAMAQLDKTIVIGAIQPTALPTQPPVVKPSPTPSIWASLLSGFLSIFKKGK